MNKKGFTLIEMLIYTSLLGIFLVVLSNIFSSALDVQLESESVSSVEQDTRYIVSRLTYDIHRADSVSLPANPGDSTQSLQLIINGVNYTYSLSGTDLLLTDNTGSDILNSFNTSISALNFQRMGNPGGKHNIKVSMQIESDVIRSEIPDTLNINTSISMR